jgi:hypothetical protein
MGTNKFSMNEDGICTHKTMSYKRNKPGTWHKAEQTLCMNNKTQSSLEQVNKWFNSLMMMMTTTLVNTGMVITNKNKFLKLIPN